MDPGGRPSPGSASPALRGPPLRRVFGLPSLELWLKNVWHITSMAGCRFQPMFGFRYSIVLRIIGWTPRSIESLFAQGLAQDPPPFLGAVPQFVVTTCPLVPFAEELVGDIERCQDREFGLAPGREPLFQLPHLPVHVGGDHLDVVRIGAPDLVLAAEDRHALRVRFGCHRDPSDRSFLRRPRMHPVGPWFIKRGPPFAKDPAWSTSPRRAARPLGARRGASSVPLPRPSIEVSNRPRVSPRP